MSKRHDDLQSKAISEMKLHLGCGQTYFPDYINIDFPSTSHTVQIKSVADRHCDILDLNFAPGSIAEIRLHHVFEHFTRPVALALLATWNRWLMPGGLLRIEVPDFQRTSWSLLNPLSSKKAHCVGLRHIFGSNEAPWAVHYEGWTKRNFLQAAKSTGFHDVTIVRNSFKHTYNIEFYATKSQELMNHIDWTRGVENFLDNFLVDESEKELLTLWMSDFQNNLDRMARGLQDGRL